MAQSSLQGTAPLAMTPARQPPQGPNSPPSGSSRTDSWIRADVQRDLAALKDRDGDIDLPEDLPPFPLRGWGDSSAERGRSRSPQERGIRIRGTRVMEHVQLEMEPDMEELFCQGQELHNQWRVAEQKVRWCEQHMVTLDQHERAQAEVRLLDEQATEIMLREQHNRFAALINKAMEEREQAVKAGQQAQEEAQRATRELQRVYNDATAHVQKQDTMLEDAMNESDRWSQMALRQEGIARDTEARLQSTEQRLQTLELRADEEFDRLRTAADDFRQEYEVAERQRAESQGAGRLVDQVRSVPPAAGYPLTR